MTAREFINAFLKVVRISRSQLMILPKSSGARRSAAAADRKKWAYSKGMRRFVWAIELHTTVVLILDEPLNGLDPMVRAERSPCQELAVDGLHLIISSHILHEST